MSEDCGESDAWVRSGAPFAGGGASACDGCAALIGIAVSAEAASATHASAARAGCAWAAARGGWARAVTLGEEASLEAFYAAAKRVDVGDAAFAELFGCGEAAAAAGAD
jgi:hypothetical protein